MIRQDLADYGRRIGQRGLTAGAGGNISARDGRLVWVKPSGFAMEALTGKDMVCVDLESGRLVEGLHKPTSELPMHLAVYRARPDVRAIFHTHSPWASGVITSDADIRPMFAEVVNDLGGVVAVPKSMKQAYYRCCVAEDAAKSFVAASIVGKPRFLTDAQVADLKKLEAGAYRTRVAETEG